MTMIRATIKVSVLCQCGCGEMAVSEMDVDVAKEWSRV